MSIIVALLIPILSVSDFHLTTLETTVGVWDVEVADMNGDGRQDIIALCNGDATEPNTKCIQLFLAGEDGSYPAHPTVTLPLNDDVGAAYLTEVDGVPPRELAVVNAQGASVYRYIDGAFVLTQEPRFVSLFPTGAKEPVFLKDTSIDVNGDDIEEWFIPVPGGYDLRSADAKLAELRCDMVSEIRRGSGQTIYHRLPAIHVFARDANPGSSIAFLSDEFADFAYGEDWKQTARFKVPVNLKEKWEAATRMDDINGDGLPDLVVTQTQGTAQIKVMTQVYLAQAPYTYSSTPTATFEAQGAIASPFIRDVDNDGKLDVVIIKVPFGAKSMWNFFVMRKVAVEVSVYLFKGDGFGATPDFEQALSLDAPEGREQIAYTMGDFNGDGRLDVAFGSSKNKLVVHTGTPERFLTARPWITIETPTFGVARPYDLDGNDRQDIIIFHPGIDHKNKIEVIRF